MEFTPGVLMREMAWRGRGKGCQGAGRGIARAHMGQPYPQGSFQRIVNESSPIKQDERSEPGVICSPRRNTENSIMPGLHVAA